MIRSAFHVRETRVCDAEVAENLGKKCHKKYNSNWEFAISAHDATVRFYNTNHMPPTRLCVPHTFNSPYFFVRHSW